MYHIYLPIAVHGMGFHFYNKKYFKSVDVVLIIFAPTHVYQFHFNSSPPPPPPPHPQKKNK